MNEKTRRFFESHIAKLLDSSSFANRTKNNPKDCPCHASNPCHSTLSPDQLNCLLCYCPEYIHEKPEGGCRINSKFGKWFEHPSHPNGRIWDCSDCDYPHRPEVVKKYLRKLFRLED